MSRKRIWSLKWQTKTKKKRLAIYRSWPWISNCWEVDSNSGLSGIEPSVLTTRPRRLGANLRRDATSCLLFLNQSVLADFDHRKKKTTGFKTRSLSGTSNSLLVIKALAFTYEVSAWSANRNCMHACPLVPWIDQETFFAQSGLRVANWGSSFVPPPQPCKTRTICST